MNPEVLYLLYLGAGLLTGALLGWLFARSRSTNMTPESIEKSYVPKQSYHTLEAQLDGFREDLREKDQELLQREKELAENRTALKYLQEKLDHQLEEMAKWQKQSTESFENLANRIFTEKSDRFRHQSQSQLEEMLKPLKERIKDFESDIDKKFVEDHKQQLSLKIAIDQLRELNGRLSEDANRLATALKGDSKIQGDWGEYQLELLLKKSGLFKDIHYRVQPSFKDENGQDKRPDFIVNLPEGKHLILDSKVSLTAFERYFNEEEPLLKAKHLKGHIDSVRQHIKGLSDKNYQQLYQINSPDYLLLFIPLESAFTLALHEDNKLFLDALERNIVLVSTSTLLATMRTVSYIWRQEKQKRSVLEIARQSGLLYDRFVTFVDDLKLVGSRLDQAHIAYEGAMHKLTAGKRFGDTLVGRAQKIVELGAKASKHLPKDLIEDALELGEEE
ncbi:MAG: DNA recombination protein RmuC [Saprospiraceae bacterium]|nr:DNA recombination protein RmuC [Saprospiraceae bacterium]